jgi:hypothetical protein
MGVNGTRLEIVLALAEPIVLVEPAGVRRMVLVSTWGALVLEGLVAEALTEDRRRSPLAMFLRAIAGRTSTT